MSYFKTTTTALLGAALLCGIAQFNPASAQDGEGRSTRRIIINGANGTQELQVDGNDLDGQQVLAISVNGSNGTFTFIGDPRNLPFGGSLGPLGFFAMASGGVNSTLVPIDPGVSYIHQLIKRPDVGSELFLNSKQREQLEDMENAENLAAQQRIAQLGGAAKGAAGGGTDKDSLTDRAKSLHDMIQGSADEGDRKLAAILTAKQVQRLKELDLQYRGPLAMGVKPVADKALLTNVQAPAVADMLKEYRESVRKALGVEQKVTQSSSPDGSRSVNINTSVSASPDEIKARLEKAHDNIEQSRRILGAKALKSIAETQRTEWQTLTGMKFQFQTLN